MADQPRRVVVEIADRDAELQRQKDSRERTYRKLAADAEREKAETEAQVDRVLGWDEQGEEIRRLNSRALGVVGSIIDGTASAFMHAAAGVHDSDEVKDALWKLASFDNALTNLARCSTISRTWAARGDVVTPPADPSKLTDEEIRARLAAKQ